MEVTTLLLILLTATNKGCYASSENPMQPFILNGTNAKPGDFPYMVALADTNHGHHFFCGGSLISSKYVLTAAHCLNSDPFLVYLGAHNLTNRNEKGRLEFRISPDSVKIHDKYDRVSLANDVALIRLPTNVQFTKTIQRIPLADKLGSLVGKTVTIVGWGGNDSTSASEVLQYGQAQVSRDDECKNVFGKQFLSSNLCVSGKGQQPCAGDSGGPAIIRNAQGTHMLVGVASFQEATGCPSRYSAYGSIKHFAKWIHENAK